MTQPAQALRVIGGSTLQPSQPGSPQKFRQEVLQGPDTYSLGAMTQDLHTWEGRRSDDKPDILDIVNYHFLNLELDHKALNAGQLENMARDLTLKLSDRLEELFENLPPRIRETICQMAKADKIDEREAKIQYLANDCLFRLIRDHFKLPRVKENQSILQNDSCGFVALTCSGSIISSPPKDVSNSQRIFYYMRMPVRKITTQTGLKPGFLMDPVSIKNPVNIATSGGTLRTSGVRILLKIPFEKAGVFEKVRQSSELGSSIVHHTLTGIG